MKESNSQKIQDLATIKTIKKQLQHISPEKSELINKGEYVRVMKIILEWEKNHENEIFFD